MSGDVPAWANGYVGVPFLAHGRSPAGWDCWGLVWWCLGQHLGVRLPSYAEAYADPQDPAEIAGVMAGRMAPWRALRDPLDGGERPRLGDVALLRRGRHPTHVGLVVNRRQMLHVEAGIATQYEDVDGIMWRRRVVGIYRHQDMEPSQARRPAVA